MTIARNIAGDDFLPVAEDIMGPAVIGAGGFPHDQCEKRYASGHHERLDGSGYHKGHSAEDLPIQTRILVLADIFEALTAGDRPYRKALLKVSRVIEILGLMVKDGHIDGHLHDLLLHSEVLSRLHTRSLASGSDRYLSRMGAFPKSGID